MEDCGAWTLDYVTICLYKIKVNNGTSQMLWAKLRTMPGCDYRQTVLKLFMTTKTLLM